MSTITAPAPTAPQDDVDRFADRVLSDTVTALELLSVHVGLETGLYAALDAAGPTTATRLAELAGVSDRYAREWLEQQTAAGFVVCDDPTVTPEQRTFRLPAHVATVLLEPDGGAYLAPLIDMVRGITDVLGPLLTAYRTGGGVPYGDYGLHIRRGIGELNAPSFDANVGDWLRRHPAVHERLGTVGGRVLDVGCGIGRSTLAIARVYPLVRVHGIDLDEASIAEARRAAADAGLADRVTFEVADAAGFAGAGYDLVTIFETLHDTGDPVGVLRAAHAALTDGGVLHLADELVADRFGDGFDVVERLQYGFSVLHCLPATMAEQPVHAHGTVLRAPTVRSWAEEAGFAGTDVLAIEDPFWRHYRLTR